MEKVGRNDPCPCGSGKKYKNCHLGKDDVTKKTYTAAGKRKFKAKVLSSSDMRSQSVFTGSTPQAPAEMPSFDTLKVRFAKSDFRVKEGETQAAPLPFAIPKPGESIEEPTLTEGSKELPQLPEGEFKATTQDFRKKKKSE